MDISGLQKLTLLDYPGKCACTVFLAGCNLRCPFCHNASLVTGAFPALMDGEAFFRFLDTRRGLLDGVCVTGGEPTLRAELPDFLRRIKAAGFSVKLDTNGSNPALLRQLTGEGVLDYVAMDIKNSPDRYTEACGGVDILDAVQQSIDILMAGPVDYEFRTTCCKPLHDADALETIGAWLSGAKQFYLQAFVDSGDLVGTGIRGFEKKELEALRQAVLPYIPNTRIRGI